MFDNSSNEILTRPGSDPYRLLPHVLHGVW
jgi:hypothetical protein